MALRKPSREQSVTLPCRSALGVGDRMQGEVQFFAFPSYRLKKAVHLALGLIVKRQEHRGA